MAKCKRSLCSRQFSFITFVLISISAATLWKRILTNPNSVSINADKVSLCNQIFFLCSVWFISSEARAKRRLKLCDPKAGLREKRKNRNWSTRVVYPPLISCRWLKKYPKLEICHDNVSIRLGFFRHMSKKKKLKRVGVSDRSKFFIEINLRYQQFCKVFWSFYLICIENG